MRTKSVVVVGAVLVVVSMAVSAEVGAPGLLTRGFSGGATRKVRMGEPGASDDYGRVAFQFVVSPDSKPSAKID